MAKEWYLMRSPHDQVSGYESEAYTDFGEEGFLEILDSDLVTDVEIYNNDMSEMREMKVIIQNRLQDTKLKTFVRHMISPIGTSKAGMYVKFKGRFWIIVGIVDDNGIYEKSILSICNYLLTWVNDEGQIIQRWANVSSASQYNNGETATHNYSVRTDQLLVIISDDDECVLLDNGKRFIIDKRCSVYEKRFDESVTENTTNMVAVYELTRADSVLYDYSDSGHFEFLATQTEKREKDGYYKIDGKGYWLCEPDIYVYHIDTELPCEIVCDDDIVYNGLESAAFNCIFYDSEGNVLNDVMPNWEVECDFTNQLNIEQDGNTLLISVDNRKLVNKSLNIKLSADGYTPVTKTVWIRSFL